MPEKHDIDFGPIKTSWTGLIVSVVIVILLLAGLGWADPLNLMSQPAEEEEPTVPDVLAPPEDRVPAGKVAVLSTIKVPVVDLLDEYAAVADEASAIKIYQLYYGPENGYPTETYSTPTSAVLRDTVAISSGYATSGYEYWSGTYVFYRSSAIGTFNASSDIAYFDYGLTEMVPYADSDQASALIMPSLELVMTSDYEPDANNTDMYGQYPLGTDSWVTDAAVEIDVASLDEITLGIRVYQDDDDQAYSDWRPWVDYSALAEGTEAKLHRSNYIVFDFQLAGGTSIGTSVDDYLFIREPGWTSEDTSGATTTAFYWGTGVTVFIPCTTMDMAGARDVDSASYVIDNHDGYKIVASLLIDVGAVPDATDEIDINISFVSGYALAYAADQSTLDYSSSDYYSFGEVYTAWGNDWSLG